MANKFSRAFALFGLVVLSVTASIVYPPSISNATVPVNIDVVAGENHTCALFSNQNVECWGDNRLGQLGDGTSEGSANFPVKVTNLSQVTALTSGENHICALLSDQTVKCWGDNTYGQLGDGTEVNRNVPVQVTGLTGVTAISSGRLHTCALLASKTVRCWGVDNVRSTFSLGSDYVFSNQPVDVAGLSGVTAISSNRAANCALLQDRTVSCWGVNYGSNNSNTGPVEVSGLSDVISISGVGLNTCATLENKTVMCWGMVKGWYGYTFEIAPNPVSISELSNISTRISYMEYNGCNLLTDSSVSCWNGSWAQVGPIGLSNVAAIAGGGGHFCVLYPDESLKCWGQNWKGQLGDGTYTNRTQGNFKNVLRLSRLTNTGEINIAGSSVTGETLTANVGLWDEGVALTYRWLRDGNVISGAVGQTYVLQNSDANTNVAVEVTGSKAEYKSVTKTSGSRFISLKPSINSYKSVSAGFDHSCGISTLGVARCWGLASPPPTTLVDVSKVSSGRNVTCAIAGPDSNVSCWANNAFAEYSSAPLGMGAVTDISAGKNHACGITIDGNAFCWGSEEYGRTLVPADLGQVAQISTGDFSTCALTIEGNVRCWGYYLTDAPNDLGKAKQITVGADHACAVTLANTVSCWGHSSYGELNIPQNLGSIKQVDAGDGFTCALAVAGPVTCWGYNFGQNLSVPFLDYKTIGISVGAEHACAISSQGNIRCWGNASNGRTTLPANINKPVSPPISFDFNSLTGMSIQVGHAITPNDGTLIWKVKQQTAEICQIPESGSCQIDDLVPGESYTYNVTGQNEAGQTGVVEKTVKFCPTQTPGIDIPATYAARTKQKIKFTGSLLMPNLCDPFTRTVEYRKRIYGKSWTTWKKITVDVKGKFSFTDAFDYNSKVELRAKLSSALYTTKAVAIPVSINYALPLSFYTKATKIKSGYTQGGTITVKFGGDKAFNGTCTVRASTTNAFNFALVWMGSESHFTTFKVKNGYGTGKITMRWNGQVDVGALCEDPKFVRIMDLRTPILRSNF